MNILGAFVPFLPISCVASMKQSPAILSHEGKCACWWQHPLKWEQLHSGEVSSKKSQSRELKEEENSMSWNQERLPKQQWGYRRMAQAFVPWLWEKGMGPHGATSPLWQCEVLLKKNTVNTVLPLSVFLFLFLLDYRKSSSVSFNLVSDSLSINSTWRPQTKKCPFCQDRKSVV